MIPTLKNSPLVLLTLCALALLSSSCRSENSGITIQILEIEGSGQAGTAVLRAVGEQTEVVLSINPGPPENEPQPVHIHFGTCGANLGRVQFSLVDLAKGESTTIVPEPLNVFTDGNHAINLHKSYSEMKVYNACGNIPVQ